jgi:SAM-dependent methyltransferase
MADKASAYIEHQKRREQDARDAQSRIDSVVSKIQAMPEASLPPLWMMNKIGSHSVQHFKNTAVWTFVELLRRGQINDASRVIDIGSGCGRLALPFSHVIKTGAYFGTDVFDEGINWCNEHITSRNSSFKFILQTVENNYYFGGATKPSETLSLGFAEGASVDFVFATSVFTHLVEQDARRYLDEIARCLKPGGIAYVTCFIIDQHFSQFVARTGMHSAVNLVSAGHYQAYSGQDFFAGYEMARWRDLVANAGLEISGFDPGTWSEKLGALNFQDSFILTKQGG